MDAKDTGQGEVTKLDDLTMWQVATLALYELGGSRQRVHSEDVAIQCHRLSPGRFGWKKHRQYPNLGAASEALNDARRERNGSLISGSPAEGWIVTTAGIDWVLGHENLISPTAQVSATRFTSGERRLIRDLKAQPLFSEWQNGGSFPSAARVASSLLLSASTPPDAIRRRAQELTALSRIGGDASLESYLSWLNDALAVSH